MCTVTACIMILLKRECMHCRMPQMRPPLVAEVPPAATTNHACPPCLLLTPLLPHLPAGAKTPLAGFITAWVVGFVLLFLTPIFEKIPYNTLAAVIIVGVSSLFEWDYALQLFRVRLWDFLVFMTGEGGGGLGIVAVQCCCAVVVPDAWAPGAVQCCWHDAVECQHLPSALRGWRALRGCSQLCSSSMP